MIPDNLQGSAGASTASDRVMRGFGFERVMAGCVYEERGPESIVQWRERIELAQEAGFLKHAERLARLVGDYERARKEALR